MSNSYYNHTTYPTPNSPGSSAQLRAELELITTGFNKLPTLSLANANKLVAVDGTGAALTVTTVLPALNAIDSDFIIDDNADLTKQFRFEASGITTGTLRVLTVPDANTTLVGTDVTQTLTNKTLTSPVIGTIVNTGTLTLPTSTDTLVGRATTDTLTNKTLTAPAINNGTMTGTTLTSTSISGSTNTITNIGNSSLVNSTFVLGGTTVTLGTTALTISGLNSLGATAITGALTGTVGATTANSGAFTSLTASGAFSIPNDTVDVAEGGTGSGTASGARTNLGAAKSGVNGDITSLTGLTTALSVAQGGSGVTTITGILKGNGGSAFSAATAGTDYLAPFASQSANVFYASPNGTTGTPTFRSIVAADIPTLNQNTTGTAAAWTTARNLAGNSVNGTANVAFANKFIVQGTTDTGLSGAQFLGALGTGLVKNTTTTGVLSIAAAATDYVAPSSYASANGLTLGTGKLLGRSTAGTGAAEEITVGSGLSMTGGVLASTSSGGSVTTVSVVSANGFAGTVANPSSTPAITLSTSITGLLQGNGAALSAVTIGTGLSFVAGTLSSTSAMVYPGSGIPNSTGSAWGTSYSTSGSGTVVALATSPSFTTPALGVATGTSLVNSGGFVSTSSYGGSFTTGIAVDATGGLGRISVSGTNGITFYNNGVGSAALMTLSNGGIITSSTWQASTIGVGYGGTGQTSYTDGQLLIGNSTGNTLTKATLTAGTSIGITNGSGAITITNSAPMVYPGSGIAVSTGSAWGTSKAAPSGVIVGDSDTQTLTNKTLTSPVIGTITNTGTLTLPTSTDTLVGRATTDTLTNKRITSRVVSITGAAGGAITPTSDTADQYTITALGASCSFAAPSGTPTDGQKLTIRIYSAAAQSITSWASTTGGYRAIGVTLPSTTGVGKTIYVGSIWNAADSKWDVVSVASQA